MRAMHRILAFGNARFLISVGVRFFALRAKTAHRVSKYHAAAGRIRSKWEVWSANALQESYACEPGAAALPHLAHKTEKRSGKPMRFGIFCIEADCVEARPKLIRDSVLR